MGRVRKPSLTWNVGILLTTPQTAGTECRPSSALQGQGRECQGQTGECQGQRGERQGQRGECQGQRKENTKVKERRMSRSRITF